MIIVEANSVRPGLNENKRVIDIIMIVLFAFNVLCVCYTTFKKLLKLHNIITTGKNSYTSSNDFLLIFEMFSLYCYYYYIINTISMSCLSSHIQLLALIDVNVVIFLFALHVAKLFEPKCL